MGKHKGFLVLVEGDELSDRVLKIAKKLNFEGTTLILPWEQAEMQGVPLPRLFIDNTIYGPFSIYSYFNYRLHKSRS